MALINYVAAAHAAQNQGAYDRRNNYLRLAQNISSHNVFAVGLVQARLQFISNQLEGAVATLHHLKEISPKHQLVLQLLYKVYLQLNDWENLRDLLPLLRRRRVLNMNELATLEQQVYVILLNANIIKDLEGLHKAWRDVPRYLRHNAVILVAYSERLIAYGADEEAESLLRKALAELWDEKLVECYSKVKGKNPVKQLAVAESWLQGHESPLLFLCLGRLCKRQSLWGKARYYLEKSLKLLPTRAAYYELGTIMEMENDQHNALLCYRKSCEVE
jgi:HemY protein